MRIFHSPKYTADIGDHVMPIRKFDLVRQEIEVRKLATVIAEPARASEEDLLRVHTPAYIRAVTTGEPRALAESQKFPWSERLADAVRWTNGGCIAALEAALEDGVAGNLSSGFHHAHADHGEGFCTFNGLIVALDRARHEGRIARGLVVDLDLHYGNGTASLLASRPDLFALSLYGNWYKDNKAYRDVDAERAKDTDNSWSAPIANGTGGEGYLALLDEHLPRALVRSRPDVIVYQAGADPYREDPYSPLDMSVEDLYERDRRVFEAAKRAGIPIAWVLAGGYTKEVAKVVAVHANTARAALDVFGG